MVFVVNGNVLVGSPNSFAFILEPNYSFGFVQSQNLTMATANGCATQLFLRLQGSNMNVQVPIEAYSQCESLISMRLNRTWDNNHMCFHADSKFDSHFNRIQLVPKLQFCCILRGEPKDNLYQWTHVPVADFTIKLNRSLQNAIESSPSNCKNLIDFIKINWSKYEQFGTRCEYK